MTFEQFFALPAGEQAAVFSATSASMGVNAVFVEKDFWVCATLDALFNRAPRGAPRLLFKGGTSLSKAFGMIKRFSEDIDIVVSREDLGFSGDKDPINPTLSNAQRDALFGQTKEACRAHMHGELATSLTRSLQAMGAVCNVVRGDDDPDDQTLLVEYQTLFESDGLSYVAAAVRIEGGARSALEPAVKKTIVPYVASEVRNPTLDVGNVTVISSARTLWENVLILHGRYSGVRDNPEKYLPADNNRLSRHYYDVAVMSATLDGESALRDRPMLDAVRGHNLIAFRQGWKKFDEAVPGKVRLVPQEPLRKVLEKDYEATQAMIFGEPPKFNWIMSQLERAEKIINS